MALEGATRQVPQAKLPTFSLAGRAPLILDLSLSYATTGELGPNEPNEPVTREFIQQAGYQVLGNDPKWPGLYDAGQMAFAIGSRCAARFPFTLGERRTRRNDLWYRFLS